MIDVIGFLLAEARETALWGRVGYMAYAVEARQTALCLSIRLPQTQGRICADTSDPGDSLLGEYTREPARWRPSSYAGVGYLVRQSR